MYCSFSVLQTSILALIAVTAAHRAIAAEPDAEKILKDALQVVAEARSLSYQATVVSQVVDQDRLPEQPVGGPGRAFAPNIPFDATPLPMKAVRTTARVVWQRLPAQPGDDGPRVAFSIDGGVDLADSNDKAEADPKKPPEKNKEAGRKKVADKAPSTRQPVRIAFNGSVMRTLDARSKTVIQVESDDGELPVVGLGGVFPLLDCGFLPGELSAEDRAEGMQVRYKGNETVAGQKCHVIEIESPLNVDLEGEPPAGFKEMTYTRRLYLAESDLLPRRVENQPPFFPGMAAEPEAVRVNFSEVRLNPAVKPADFDLPVPDDYELRELEDEVSSGLETGDVLTDMALPDREGQERVIEEFRGKLVLLDFWASWCPPCKQSMPGIEALHNEFKDAGLLVIGVSIDADEEIVAAKEYLDEEKFTYLQLFDGSDFSEDLGLRSIPHVILLDGDGRVVYQHTGASPKAEKKLRKAIEQNLPKVKK